jgi:DNA ligase D-like protein (predicted 3'-phosphoesterase)
MSPGDRTIMASKRTGSTSTSNSGSRSAKADDRLESYRSKRHFDRTGEPSGRSSGGGRRRAQDPIFVIQQHQASSHHYDVRLEIDGVLVSWAVPKGPSTDPAVKRLAIRTEDHPLDYADFEGRIPEDEYGGGTVQVWDRGPYRNLAADDADKGDKGDRQRSMSQALEDGRIEVVLAGEKLRGGYVFIHTDGKRWLMIKMKDQEADARRNPVSTQQESVLSGRSIDEIAEQEAQQSQGRD